jgi:hypothetical protein
MSHKISPPAIFAGGDIRTDRGTLSASDANGGGDGDANMPQTRMSALRKDL